MSDDEKRETHFAPSAPALALSVMLASLNVPQRLLRWQTQLHKESLHGYALCASVVLFYSAAIFLRNKRRAARAPGDTPTLVNVCHYEKMDARAVVSQRFIVSVRIA